MRRPLIAALIFGLAACGPSPSGETESPATQSNGTDFDPESAELSLEATPLDATRVEFVISTNLPTPIEVMVSIGLSGQKPDDVFIGHSEKVSLNQAKTEFILDTSGARNPLPSGEYDAEVDFYPRWGAENGNPNAASAPRLSAAQVITLGGSGENRADAERRNELQRWVMSNVYMNVPWNREAYEARLGPARKGPSTMSRLHDAYYFADADMTFMVNRLKDEITVWRTGDVTE